MDSDTKEIYFNVGLGKVASTYLQYRVFPKFKGIHYIQRTKYRKAKQIIENSADKTFFISREFDNQLEDEVKDFAANYPEAKPIILLRRHDEWIASQYRRYIKNGRPHSFQEFFDIETDKGEWKQSALYFYDKIQALETYFTRKPMVLFYDDLKKNPWSFFNDIARVMGATYEKDSISLNKMHTSYNDKQLKIRRNLNKYTYKKEYVDPNNIIARVFKRTWKRLKQYSILYIALLLPYKNNEPLIPKDQLEKIKDFYTEDWEKCIAYAKEHNP